jgi:hypothetical protein
MINDASRSFKNRWKEDGRKVELPDDSFGVEPNQHVVLSCR